MLVWAFTVCLLSLIDGVWDEGTCFKSYYEDNASCDYSLIDEEKGNSEMAIPGLIWEVDEKCREVADYGMGVQAD
jgi:hypothetical protein